MRFTYLDYTNINRHGHIKKEHIPRNEIIIKFNADLLEIIKIFDFMTMADILSKLGGYKALLSPLLTLAIPFFML